MPSKELIMSRSLRRESQTETARRECQTSASRENLIGREDVGEFDVVVGLGSRLRRVVLVQLDSPQLDLLVPGSARAVLLLFRRYRIVAWPAPRLRHRLDVGLVADRVLAVVDLLLSSPNHLRIVHVDARRRTGDRIRRIRRGRMLEVRNQWLLFQTTEHRRATILSDQLV